VALPRRQPVDLGPDPGRQPDHDLSGHHGAGPEGRPVPPLRRRSVLRGRGRAARVDLGRLHDDEPVPVLGFRRPGGGRVALGAGAGPVARRGRELPP
jgi:hypothetical protein